MTGIRKSTAERASVCAQKLTASGYTLEDSGVVRGELRWFHIKRGARTVYETPNMRLLERYTDKLCRHPPPPLPATPKAED